MEGGKGVQRGHKQQFLAGSENSKIDRELSEAAVRTRAGQMARFRETLRHLPPQDFLLSSIVISNPCLCCATILWRKAPC